MCGRFSLFTVGKVLSNRFDVEVDENIKPHYNISPGQNIPVIIEGEIKPALWSLVPHWAKEPSGLINARSEGIAEKPSFRDAFKTGRCLIPADGFYEWNKQTKVPYRITLKDESLFAFAGLLSQWRELLTCAIITVPPNRFVKPVHHRMPAILERKEEKKWLREPTTEVLEPYAGEMKVIKISKLINNPTTQRMTVPA